VQGAERLESIPVVAYQCRHTIAHAPSCMLVIQTASPSSAFSSPVVWSGCKQAEVTLRATALHKAVSDLERREQKLDRGTASLQVATRTCDQVVQKIIPAQRGIRNEQHSLAGHLRATS
jgi:hypothetical protein